MPLLLTPAQPLKTTAQLEVASVYVIIDDIGFNRKRRQGRFTLGYYAREEASLPDMAAQLEVNLPLDFVLGLTPAQATQVGDIEEVLEEYARHELLALLPDATIETVP